MFNYYIVQESSQDVAVSSGLSVHLILETFKEWKTYISRATVAGRRTSGALEVQMMMMLMMIDIDFFLNCTIFVPSVVRLKPTIFFKSFF